MITLTENARDQFLTLLAHNHIEGFSFGVNGGGCSGFSYNLKPMDFIDTKNDDDEVFDFDGVKIVLDGASMFALAGTEIDYKTDVMGSAFSFSNPMAAASCGCGTSFSV